MFWRLEEARLRIQVTTTSAANALNVTCPSNVCPDGKVRIITKYGYYPDATETQTVSFQVFDNGTSYNYGLYNPVSLALNPAFATPIEQGMEYILFPGQTIIVRRGAATAGTAMIACCEYIEIDLPLYTYDEPQVVKRQQQALSTLRQVVGGGATGSSPGSRIDRTRTPGERTKA